ncbi:MAG TPA: type II secretion system protein [Usitatibacter sp.]|nr:type II secretion system protein [Usitatibacter sp.]
MRLRPILERFAGRARGFALLEMGVVLAVLAVMLTGLALPLAAQVQLHRQAELRRTLREARDALLGFAATHGRLPCPAVDGGNGLEAFAPGADASTGECAAFYGGYLPAATLGLAGLDSEGFLRDPWGSPNNRIRYAVYGGAVGGVANPLTRTDGLQAATLSGIGAAPRFLVICSSGREATGAGCGPATRQLTRRAAFVILSLGPNATATPAPASDEARNLDGDAVFVSHEASAEPGNAFDDMLLWEPIHLLTHRLIVAGRLP